MCRRVVAYYLIFSLASLACTVGAGWQLMRMSTAGLDSGAGPVESQTEAPQLSSHGTSWLALGALLSLAILGGGAVVLQRTLRVADQIDRQLSNVDAHTIEGALQVGVVLGRGASARGWNRLVEFASHAASQEGLHQRLSAALEQYRRQESEVILNGLPEGVAVTDQRGRISFANPTMQALLCETNEEQPPALPIGEAMYSLLSTAAGADEIAPFLDTGGQHRNVIVEVIRQDDEDESVLRIARHPLRAVDGGSTGRHIWSARDVTQQKLAEKMHADFVNSATHELRTPMANIKAYAETLALEDHLEVEEQKEFCNTINAEVSRLSRLIDDLLNIESMEVGSLSLNRSETDVERLLQEKVETARPQMTQKDLTFMVSLPDKLPEMTIDKDKIALALDNLLGNAAKYTPSGGEVALRVDVDDSVLQIQVQDSGVGIGQDDLSKVFDKFFRSDDPRVRDETGTGLGLAMTREIVHLHGGEISVQSKIDEGTTFSMTLPLG